MPIHAYIPLGPIIAISSPGTAEPKASERSVFPPVATETLLNSNSILFFTNRLRKCLIQVYVDLSIQHSTCFNWNKKRILRLCMLGSFFIMFLLSADLLFSKLFFSFFFKEYYLGVIQIGTRSGPTCCRLNLGPNCLKRLLADNISGPWHAKSYI